MKRESVAAVQARHLNGANGVRYPYAIQPGFMGPAPKKCQWIDGRPTGDDSCKCGQRAVWGKAYCEDHLERAYEPEEAAA